jgi:predicted DNA-binding protein (MmcQ/YjbR family)
MSTTRVSKKQNLKNLSTGRAPRDAESRASRTSGVVGAFERPLFARVRRLCLSFPETTERSAWGHPNFRAGKKVFCAFEIVRGRPSIAFRLSPSDLDLAMRQKSVFSTPYGRGRWASVWVDGSIDWRFLHSLCERSYRAVAAKKLLRLLDSRRGPS